MSKFAFTRRQFNLMLVASAVAFQAEGGAQEPALPGHQRMAPLAHACGTGAESCGSGERLAEDPREVASISSA